MNITQRRSTPKQRGRHRSHLPGRGSVRPAEPLKGTHTEVITMDTYVVNPNAVADAIVARLLAGKTIKPN